MSNTVLNKYNYFGWDERSCIDKLLPSEKSAFSKPEVINAFETLDEIFNKTFDKEFYDKMAGSYHVIHRMLLENSNKNNQDSINSIEDIIYLLEDDNLAYKNNPDTEYKLTKIQFLYLKSFAIITHMFKCNSFPWISGSQNHVLKNFMDIINTYKNETKEG